MRMLKALGLTFFSTVFLGLLVACGGDDPTPTPQPAAQAPAATPTAVPQAAEEEKSSVVAPKPTPTAVPPTPTAASRDLAAYFDRQTIQVVVTYAPGGGYDTFGRLFAKYAPKHLPGNPRFVVRNIVGAGGERGLVNVMRDTSGSGLKVVVVHPRFFKRELLGDDVPEFDIGTVNILGTPTATSTITSTYIMRESLEGRPLTWASAAALAAERNKALTRGGNAPGDTGTLSETFVEALGGPVKMVYGYNGSSEIMAAFDRGELDLGPGSRANVMSLYPDWVADDRLIPLWRHGPELDDDPDYVDWITKVLGEEIPPHLFDLMDPTEGERAVFSLTETVNDVLARTFALPPNVPQDITDVWVKAFKDTIADPEFNKSAQMLGRPVKFAGGEQIRKSLDAGRVALEKPELRELFSTMAGA